MNDRIALYRGFESRALLQSKLRTNLKDSANFFLSRVWMEHYLSYWPHVDYYGFIGVEHSAFIALSSGNCPGKFFVKHRSIGLNASSSLSLSSVTLESNGIIAHERYSFTDCFPKILDELLEKRDWDELRVDALSAVDGEAIAKIASSKGLLTHVFAEQKTYATDLDLIRKSHGGNFLASRSANTRAQLRKALRGIEQKLGPVSIKLGETEEQVNQWLVELAALHMARWNKDGNNNGFANPVFFEFQKSLVKNCFDNGTLQMLRMDAGTKPVAYLYNFVWEGKTLFYMGGVDYEGIEHLKPGLLAHWFAIEHNLAVGAKTYDFLVGTNRYKESLCTEFHDQVSLRLRRPTILLTLEHWLRQIKRSRNSDKP